MINRTSYELVFMYLHDIFMCLLSPLPPSPKKWGMITKLISQGILTFSITCLVHTYNWNTWSCFEERRKPEEGWGSLYSAVQLPHKAGSWQLHTHNSLQTQQEPHWHLSEVTQAGLQDNKVWNSHCPLPVQQPRPCTQKEHSFIFLINLYVLVLSDE